MDEFLQSRLGPLLAAVRSASDSLLRFDDGGQYRVEIPSVEGVAAFEAVLESAAAHGVAVHRISQGSGITLLRDDDIARMAALGAEQSVEVSLFVGPRAPWDTSASARAPDGKFLGWRHTTTAQLRHAYLDVVRAVELGIRSVLVADEGLVWLVDQARRSGALPQDLVMKASAMLGVANPIGARLLEGQGVDTINVASDISVGELAAFRHVCGCPFDLYIESPDSLGGFVRYHELVDIVRVAAPIHLKFGLRNAANLYPSGQHLERAAVETGRERVRRAAIGLETLARSGIDLDASPTGAPRRGLPVPA